MTGEQILQNTVTEIFNPLYKLAVALAILYFLYGVFKFIMDMNDPEKKNFGKAHLLYGTIGLFIILSVGGIIQFFSGLFGGVFTY
jgi:hypothetical protein